MTPKEAYFHAIDTQGFSSDPVQAEAVKLTHALYQQLINRISFSPADGYWQRLIQLVPQKVQKKLFSSSAIPPVQGLYFWGGVGRGKTWLVDSFYRCLPFSNKRRVHFHAFMHEVHEQLVDLPKTPDPLPILAQQMAREFQLLCIDEFHVQDITDAMLLWGLLKALSEQGVILVITSNIAPDELYKNGLQRERFLPAIELIKKNAVIFELNNKADYRSLTLKKEGYYHTPLNQQSKQIMLQHFIKLSGHAPISGQQININNRFINVIAQQQPTNTELPAIAWFDFDNLCNTPRSNSDYLQIARQFKAILITGIYTMEEQKDDVAKRFIHLIDALYDHHCDLIVSAEVEPDALYHGRKLEQAFRRAASRLTEMRSELYRSKVKPK